MKTFISICMTLIVLLSGCTAMTGPRYNAQSIQLAGKPAYEVECRGLMESVYACVETAKQICLDERVQPLDLKTGEETRFEAFDDSRTLAFRCAEHLRPSLPMSAASVAATPAPLKPVATILIGTDLLFKFDRSDLAGITPQGREALQRLMAQLSEVVPQALVVSGYTDRLGSDAYNEALSTRRANSVKRYLETHGVTVPISVHGSGKKIPGTDCEVRDRAQLVACLAPDRVVEIQVMGRKNQ
jgi:outer membrane protein OmpA-like peptidoglycan-associated protein